MAVLMLLGVLYSAFFVHLPTSIFRLFALSAAVYIGGAIGMEMVGGYIADYYGIRNFAYSVVTTIEETMEMTGLGLFAYSLLQYYRSHVNHKVALEVNFADE